ncbi:PREDICTED: uncharacterized protein LOC18603083 isoform X2 [Theobroma cacao]|uniref:Uncharacterized protein LOC18603083 isoform X2 n=1 Tax=Theobroma cacao TaxID=3641 RepID=A0AB32WB26_THECC|nr:PREDICTED: uncharacterized protein LOC18603083 isoform X2 [Theobroma cacao]
MGNEMGNNNTSGLREEDNTTQVISQKEVAYADDFKGQNHVVPTAQDKGFQGKDTGLASGDVGREDPNVDDQKTENKEEDDMKTKGKKSLQEAAPTDDVKGQNHEVPAFEDAYKSEKDTGLASTNLEGAAEPHDDNQKQDEKEDHSNIIPEAKEKSLQEAAYTEEATGQDCLVPAAEDKNIHGNETDLVSSEPDGIASPHVDNQKQDEKDHSNIIPEAKEKSLQEAAYTDEATGQDCLVPAAENKNTHGNKTDLVFSEPDGIASPHVDNQKQDKKEDSSNIIPEANEKSLQGAAYSDEATGQDNLVPAAEDKNSHGNEPDLVSSEPDGIASPHVDNQKQDEKEEDSSTNLEAEEKSLQEVASTDETKAQNHLVPTAADKNTHEMETGSGFSDPDVMAFFCVENQKQDEKEEDININDETKEKSSQEVSSTDVAERQDHLLPAVEDENTNGNENGLVSSDSERTADHGDNPKQDEKEEDNTNAEPQEKPLAKDDHAGDVEEKKLTIPAAEGEDCNKTGAEAELASGYQMAVVDTLHNQTLEGREQVKTELHPLAECTKAEAKPSEAADEGRETQPASSPENLKDHEKQQESNLEENPSGISHHFENQNSMMKEDEGTRDSTSNAASSTSHDSVPQEPKVLEPEQYELAKIHTDQLVQACNGPQKSEHVIIPYLTCPDHENGFISDPSISTDMVESVCPDSSSKIEKETVDFWVKEMATKEVSNEENFELRGGDEAGNSLGKITTTMTDLPNEVGAKCNGELPSEMKSIQIDSPESQVEVILADETPNLQLEVSETEDKGIVPSHKAILVREESENGDSKLSHCQIQSEEESIEKSSGMESEEGSNADKPSASPPQFMMNGHVKEETRCLLDTSCDSTSSKDSQFEEAKTVENGLLIHVPINYQNGAIEEQQKDSQKKEIHLVTDHAVISADIFPTDQKDKEESEEKNIIEEMLAKIEDLNSIGNDTSNRESGEQCISHSYPIEQAEAFLSPSHSNQNLTEKSVISMAELAGEKPVWDLSNRPKTTPVTMAETKPSAKQCSEQRAIGETPAIANGDYYQQESVGRLSTESNSDNMSIHAQMRKSPSFDLDLRIHARAEESDQTPLLYQDKPTIDSFSSQAADDTLGKPLANTEHGKNSLHYEAMPVEEKVVTLERCDSEKSKTPFLGFLREEEEAHMLITPKKQDNHSAAKKATKVSPKEVTPAPPKGKEKRKPRTSLFGTCMCCATVIN